MRDTCFEACNKPRSGNQLDPIRGKAIKYLQTQTAGFDEGLGG